MGVDLRVSEFEHAAPEHRRLALVLPEERVAQTRQLQETVGGQHAHQERRTQPPLPWALLRREED